MNPPRTINGKWVVLGLLAVGVIAALAGLKFRRFPEDKPPGSTAPPATQTDDAARR
jgi:hypothetical protein